MVQLNRIYTRTGDAGTTALGSGERVPKTHARIEAYGAVDEVNAFLGACVDAVSDPVERDALLAVQNDLFDLGADLCVPVPPGDAPGTGLRVPAEAVTRLEGWIDAVNAGLEPLRSFVLPGGNRLCSAYHVARVVCRRAERRVLALAEQEPQRVNPHTVVYLNRLSDLLFVLARAAAGGDERLWSPGATREDP